MAGVRHVVYPSGDMREKLGNRPLTFKSLFKAIGFVERHGGVIKPESRRS